jgi:hypothetical protein
MGPPAATQTDDAEGLVFQGKVATGWSIAIGEQKIWSCGAERIKVGVCWARLHSDASCF